MDLVIVIGTSLKVAPVSNVVGLLPANVPQIYISREVSGDSNDVFSSPFLLLDPAAKKCHSARFSCRV